MSLCPKCFYKSDQSLSCPKCGLIYSKYQSTRATPKGSDPEENLLVSQMISFNHLKTNFLALPLAFGFSFICQSFQITRIVCWYFFSIPIHELGHATCSWICSRMAIPIGIFIPMAAFTTLSPHSSFLLFCIFFGLLGYAFLVGLRKNNTPLVWLTGLLMSALIFCTFILSPKSRDCLQVAGGLYGEFYLSTFFLIGFYYPLSNRLRWDFVRFLFLVPGAYTFVSSYAKWFDISHFRRGLPTGSFVGGAGDENGDVDRLIHVFGWNTNDVIFTYVHLGQFCLLLIVLHYLFFIKVSLQKSRFE